MLVINLHTESHELMGILWGHTGAIGCIVLIYAVVLIRGRMQDNRNPLPNPVGRAEYSLSLSLPGQLLSHLVVIDFEYSLSLLPARPAPVPPGSH